ncbi:MAG: hypothetical protein HWE07_09240 [Cytophagia bacterium]|nr:hypothetical protein [Cytophagia bacterium]
MALKIKTQIGTAQGIFDEVYVSLGNVTISKDRVTCPVLIYKDEEQAREFGDHDIRRQQTALNNDQIGNIFSVSLIKTKEVKKLVTATDRQGRELYEKGKPIREERMVPETSKVNQEIYTEPTHKFMYERFKAKLEGIFGKGKVVDC